MIGHRIGLAAVAAVLGASTIAVGASPASALPREDSCTYIMETINIYQDKVDYWAALAEADALHGLHGLHGLHEASQQAAEQTRVWQSAVNGEWARYTRGGC